MKYRLIICLIGQCHHSVNIITLDQCFSTFFKSRNLLNNIEHLVEPRYSKQYQFEDSQGTQEGIGGTSGFRETKVEKHWATVCTLVSLVVICTKFILSCTDNEDASISEQARGSRYWDLRPHVPITRPQCTQDNKEIIIKITIIINK